MRYVHWAFSALGTMLLGLPAHAQQIQREQQEQRDAQLKNGESVPPPSMMPARPIYPPAPPAPPVPMMPPAPPAPPLPIARTPLPAKLQGSSVYVYSFLDVRREEYTSKVLDRFDADLSARFAALKIGSNILRFRNSKMNRADEFYAGNHNQESRAIPVMETVYSNLNEERGAHARFRLIAFPSNYTVSGAWRFYEIRFLLIDAETGARLWGYTYSGKHMVMWKNSENADARAKKILDKLFSELKTAGYL